MIESVMSFKFDDVFDEIKPVGVDEVVKDITTKALINKFNVENVYLLDSSLFYFVVVNNEDVMIRSNIIIIGNDYFKDPNVDILAYNNSTKPTKLFQLKKEFKSWFDSKYCDLFSNSYVPFMRMIEYIKPSLRPSVIHSSVFNLPMIQYNSSNNGSIDNSTTTDNTTEGNINNIDNNNTTNNTTNDNNNDIVYRLNIDAIFK